jgi:hypothetical protein
MEPSDVNVNSYEHFKNLAEQALTQDFFNGVFDFDYDTFSFISDRFKTPEMCLTAVKHNPYYFTSVPVPLKTEEMSEIVVKKCIYFFKLVSDKLKTQKMCLWVVKADYIYFRHVPQELQTQDR